MLAVTASLVLPVSATYAAVHANAAHSTGSTEKVGLVVAYVKNDKGFNQSAIKGLNQAATHLHVSISTYVDYEATPTKAAVEIYPAEKYNLTIAVGALFANPVYHAALDYPHSHFAIVDGYPTNDKGKVVNLKNVAELVFKPQQAGYLVGQVAGLVEKAGKGPATHNTIGALPAFPFPFFTSLLCGYYEGARSVDRSVKLVWGYSDTFTDTSTAQTDGAAQIKDNADVLFQASDAAGLGYLKAADDGKKYAIGFAEDQHSFGKFVLTSALIHVDVAVYRTIQAQLSNAFKSGAHVFGLKNGGVGYATDMNHVSSSWKSRVAADASKISSGRLKIDPTCTLPPSV